MIAKEAARAKVQFCTLQEVRYRNSGRKIISLDTGESYIFLWCGRKKRRDAGVGILIKQSKDVSIEEPDITDPRVMAMNIQIKGFNIRLVNAYAPTNSDGSDNQKDVFYRLLRKACTKQHKHQKLLVTGDFNATTSVSLKQSFYDGNTIIEDTICNDNGARLKGFCREIGLCMTQSYFNHTLEDRFTWFSGDKTTKKVLDYILVEPYIQQYVKDCAVNPNLDFDSDHRIIIAEINTPSTKKARRKKQQKTKYVAKPDPESLQSSELKVSFIHAVTQELNSKDGAYKSTDAGLKIIDCLESAAEATLPKKSKNKHTHEIWRNDKDLNLLVDKRKELVTGSSEHKLITKIIKKRVRILRNETTEKEANEINEYASRRQVEELYRTFKSDNSSFKEYKSKKKCEPTKLKTFFMKHFTGATLEHDPIELECLPDFMETLQNISTRSDTRVGPPDELELISVIKKLKDGKSASDIPTTFIKHALGSRAFVIEIVKLYETIWETKTIPREWGHSKLVTLWKGPAKGKADDPNTYRGLQIGSSLCKIMIIVVINRLKEWYEKQLLDQQQGFRSARGTADGIFIAKSVQQITNKMKKTTFLLFVDLTAAFDHVERSWLFKSIKKRFTNDSDQTLIQLIEALYEYTSTALSETPNDKFDLTVGVRQGGPESPMLYNLYMDFVMRIYMNLCKEKGINFLNLKYKIPQLASSTGKTAMGKLTLDWCGYADDLLLVFDDIESLRQGIEILDETFRRYRLSINSSKTKTMILNQQYDNGEYPTTIGLLRGKELDNVKIYRYLGCEIKFDEPTTGTTELNLRAEVAECKFYSLSRSMMNKKINLKTRTTMLNSLVRSRIVYSCQTWSTTKTQLNRMNALYMSFIRKMTSGGYNRKNDAWSYIYSNDDLLRISQTTDLTTYIKRQQRTFVCNIVRKDNTSIVKRLMFNSDASHKPGPQTTLLSSVLKDSTPDELFRKASLRQL